MRSIEIEDAELLRQYLLGQLDAEATDALEQRLLADGELFELAEAMEGELLAACVRGELTSDEYEAVLRRLTASPHGRERLALARGLNTLAVEQAETKPHGSLLQSLLQLWRWLPLDRPAFRAAALAASLSVVVAGLWLTQQRGVEDLGRDRSDTVVQTQQTNPQPQPEGSETPSPIPEDQEAGQETPAQPERPVAPPVREEIAQPSAAEPEGSVQEIEVSSETTRGSGSFPVLELRPGTKLALVRISLAGEDTYDSFIADVSRLDTDDDRIAPESIKPEMVNGQQVAVVSLPADKLRPGRYRIMLNGVFGPGEEPVLIGTPVFEVRAADR